MKFRIFNPTEESKQLIESIHHLHLPDFLFAGKKERDTITLKYKGELVQLLIDQHAVDSREKSNFEDDFEYSVIQSLKEIQTGSYGFDGSLYGLPSQLTEGYTLFLGGSLYHCKQKDLKDQNQGCSIVEADAKDFREKKEPRLISDKNSFYENETDVYFVLNICSIGEQVDIVLNEKFLCFFAREEVKLNSEISTTYEYLCIIPWQQYPCFENLSLEEMQDRIQNAETKLVDGRFTIGIAK